MQLAKVSIIYDLYNSWKLHDITYFLLIERYIYIWLLRYKITMFNNFWKWSQRFFRLWKWRRWCNPN
jgi:hypothetical protein